MKVKCNLLSEDVDNLQKINFGDFALDIIHLDLSENQLTKLDNFSFSNLTNLKRLDLSANLVQNLDKKYFQSMKNLEKLILRQNQIKSIPQGTFQNLLSLKQLDLSANPLKCDCDLIWILDWAQRNSVKLSPGPKCQSPSDFKNSSLKKLKVGIDMHCETPITQQNHVQLNPRYNQVVFEGDSLQIHCLISSKYNTDENLDQNTISPWSWTPHNSKQFSIDIKYNDLASMFPDINIINRFVSDGGIIDSRLDIENIRHNQSGQFSCKMVSPKMNVSKSLDVVVISNETKYCQTNTTKDNKGIYTWPATVVGNNVVLRCQGQSSGQAFATHYCSVNGNWSGLNTRGCPYVNEITKILEQFAKVNLSLTRNTIVESSRVLRNLTLVSAANITKYNDPDDVVFIVHTFHNYIEYLSQEKELGPILIDIASELMKFPKHILNAAQRLNNSCTELVRDLELTASFAPALQKNLALEEFQVNQDSFTGLTCSWHIFEDARVFHCSISNQSLLRSPQNHLIDAIIQIPPSVLRDFDTQTKSAPSSHNLLVGMFENNNFFPILNKNGSENFNILSCIVGVKIENQTIKNLNEPIQIMLRLPNFMRGDRAPIPVWWNQQLLLGHGDWSMEGCHLSYTNNELFIFTCDNVGYYALMQEPSIANSSSNEPMGAKFRFLHLAVYIGSCLQFICLMITIVTYIIYFNAILMPRKTKHSLINTWIAMLLLCLSFTLGIFQTESRLLCQTAGIIQHYLFLSCLLWMSVTVSDMYKRLSAKDPVLSDDLLQSEPPIPKPIVGLYLLGWGVSLIVCGISGAVNMKQYASFDYCFLSSKASLTTVFVPMSGMILFIISMFLIVCWAIRRYDMLGHMSEGTQATENVDIELLEPQTVTSGGRQSAQSISTPTSCEMEDQENSPKIQLKAHVIVLFLHCCMWSTAAVYISRPLKHLVIYDEDIFGSLYGISASICGVFILFFYSVARSDVRSQLETMICCPKGQKRWCRSRTISDATSNNKPQQVELLGSVPLQPISNQDAAALALSQSLHASSGKTIKRNSGNARDLIPSAEMFYNPNQSNVARKFFKKQKRHMKHNNLEIHRLTDGSKSDGGSIIFKPRSALEAGVMTTNIFATSSKVNNINIHAEQKPCNKEVQKHCNILSDTESDFIERISPHAIHFIPASDGMCVSMKHKKSNNVANIYTNVPETSLPEHQRVPLVKNDFASMSSEDTKILRPISSKILCESSYDPTPSVYSELDSTLEEKKDFSSNLGPCHSPKSFLDFDELNHTPTKNNEFMSVKQDHNNKSESPILFPSNIVNLYDHKSDNAEYLRSSSPLLEDFINYHQADEFEPNFDSDCNYVQYPTSELSIKSHGLYAPQPEIGGNDLNMTLINEADLRCIQNRVHDNDFPYQPSEISAISSLTNDNIRSGKTYQNCSPYRQSSASLNSVSDIMQSSQYQDYAQVHSTSIDDLYEQIKCRPRPRTRSSAYYVNSENFKSPHSRSMECDLNSHERNDFDVKNDKYES
ncbi:adhesion G protein-coupled receptor A3-like [Ctenocephalides felis]|uniref:adhesion G protein-coupled receptor A3-like n=1 Tax=Ctenocephalides felis TaxID=7515 RepID=UPI000E6E2AE4|nr:adhesion G protein-coupled receptor A3-like [Ctenocephalides felis]